MFASFNMSINLGTPKTLSMPLAALSTNLGIPCIFQKLIYDYKGRDPSILNPTIDYFRRMNIEMPKWMTRLVKRRQRIICSDDTDEEGRLPYRCLDTTTYGMLYQWYNKRPVWLAHNMIHLGTKNALISLEVPFLKKFYTNGDVNRTTLDYIEPHTGCPRVDGHIRVTQSNIKTPSICINIYCVVTYRVSQ